MYGLIHLADGSTEFVPNAERFERLVYEKLGRDAAEIVAELIRQGDVAAHVADTDFRAYETQNEELHSAVQDAAEMTEKLRAEIVSAARLNRSRLAESLASIWRTLDAVI